MKKRLVALVLCIVLVLSVVPTAGAASYNGTCGENLNWSFNEATGKLTITGSGRMNDYGYFGGVWTDFIDKITSVSLPEGLTTVGSYAFYGAVNLKEITFPNSLCIIGTSAFADCPLERITFGTGLQMIEGYAFENLKVKNLVLPEGLIAVENLKGDGVETLTIPTSLIEIGTYEEPMLYFPALKSVTVSASNPVFSAADGVLYSKDKTRVVLYPSARGTKLQLPDSVTDISCIEGCESIVELTLPARFTDYSALRISEMFPNVEIIHVPDTVCCLESAFYDCAKLKTVNIPAGISSLNNTFVNCASLEQVEVPDSVVMMEHAFQNCTSLKKVRIPDGVRDIDSCFEGCTALQSITVPSSVETMEAAFYESGVSDVTLCNGLKTISDNAFSQSALTEITIPDSVTSLGKGAFYRTPLETVTFGAGIEEIGEDCFYSCSGLRRLHLPQALTRIGDQAFYNMPWLTEVTLGDKLEYIGRNNFDGRNFGEWEDDDRVHYVGPYLVYALPGECEPDEALGEGKHYNHLTVREGTKLIASGAINGYYEVTLPEGMTVIPEYTFYNCNVQKVRLPSTLKEIRHDAFCDSALSEINLPEGLGSIDYRAFFNCENLNGITLPKNLTYLGNAAFDNTGYYNDKANWDNGFLYLNQALLDTDKNVVTGATVSVKTGTRLICGYALCDLPMLSVQLPEGVTMLGWGVCSGCENLNKINLPSSVTRIEGEAFYECACLRSLTLPKGLQSLGNRCFQSSGIREIAIPAGMTELPAELFKFSKLEKITIPETVKFLGDDIFWGCYDLKQVTLPQSLPAIPRYTFYGVGISELTIPATATSIGESAFDSSSIKSINIPSNVTAIGERAFANCGYLTDVKLPNGLRIISESAFLNCEQLHALTIPASVQYIAPHAFGYDDSGDYKLRDDVCIYGTPGTEAERYANANHIPFNAQPVSKQSVYNAAAVSTKFASVKVNKTSVKVGETISVSVTPKTGYEVISIVLTNSVGGSETEYCKTENENAFRMPESNVFASAVLLPLEAGHSHEYSYTMSADDTYHWRQCVCGTITDKAAHQFEWKTDCPPAADSTGLKHEECSVCGYCRNWNTVIPAEQDTPHTHNWYSACNSWQHWQACDCGETTKPEAHSYIWIIDRYATKTEAGWKHEECSVCGYTPDDGIEIPSITDTHTHSYTAVVTPPTCTEKGYTTHTCECGDSYKDTYVDALGHNYVNGVCSRCGADDPNFKPIDPDKPCDGGKDCPSYGFTDVNMGDWYHAAVDFAVQNGLFKGMTATTFEPNTPMTRGMLVTVLWRYENSPKEGTNIFTDVKNGEWYAEAVAWAAENGIVTGVGNSRFDPNGKITREQLAAILYRYSGNKGYDTSKRGDFSTFPDKNEVSSWAKDAYGWAVGEKLINGNNINGVSCLDPQGNATRAQVATILMRFIQQIAK